jgi:hypothetical protein
MSYETLEKCQKYN